MGSVEMGLSPLGPHVPAQEVGALGRAAPVLLAVLGKTLGSVCAAPEETLVMLLMCSAGRWAPGRALGRVRADWDPPLCPAAH